MRNHVKITAKRKMLSTTAFVAGAMMMSSAAHAQTATPSNSWDYDTVLGGNVGKDTSVVGTTDIYVQGGNGYVAGNADIYEGHTVNVLGDDGATFAYHDNRNFIPSTIRGALNSNMNVVIIDNDGMFFTETAEIDVQSLVATTGFVAVDDVMDGDGVLNIFDAYKNGASIVNNGLIQAQDAVLLHAQNVQNNGYILTQTGGQIILAAADQVNFTFADEGQHEFTTSEVGMILNTGTMDAGEGGLAAIIAPFQENTGVIRAKMGNIVLAAQEQVTLDYYGDGLVELAVDGELADALITNRGTIEAEGGVVNITAQAAKGSLDNIVNNEGIITASSATVQGGKIILGGGDHGTIRNNGIIKTSAGGSIDVSGERFAQGSGAVAPAFAPIPPALPAVKSGGANINIATSGDVEVNAGTIDAEGGNVEITNGGTFASNAEAVKTSGTGTITLTQNDGGEIQNAIDAIDNTGTGKNTVNVGAGTYNEMVRADHENLTLKGANAGIHGDSVRGAESVIVSNWSGIYVTADNATVDGFEIAGGTSGVRVEDADNATIINNNIHDQYHVSGEGDSYGGYAAGDGIFVKNSSGTVIDGNKIEGMNDDGIHAVRVTDITIANNHINDTGNGDEAIALAYANGATIVDGNYIIGARRDGIQIHTSTGDVNVTNNIVEGSGASGISVISTDNVNVEGNIVLDTGESGISVNSSDGALITGNNIAASDDNGVEISGGKYVDVIDNKIMGAGTDGVNVRNSRFIDVNENTISHTKDDGIDVDRSGGASIKDNGILLAKDNGIELSNSPLVIGSHGLVSVSGNKIGAVGGNGIDAENVGLFTNINANEVFGVAEDAINVRDSSHVHVFENKVGFAGDDGIDISGTPHANVNDNEILLVGDNGIEITDSAFSSIVDNIVSITGRDSINVSNSGFSDIAGNTLSYAFDDGIDIDGGALITIEDNNVLLVGDNGIEVNGSDNAGVNGNKVGYTDGNGIEISNSDSLNVAGNTIAHTGDDGIDLNNVYGADVVKNNIAMAADDGIDIDGGSEIWVEENNILQSDDDGVSISEAGEVIVYNNVIAQSGDDGVDAEYTEFVEIDENTITESEDDGVDISSTSYALVTNNDISGSGDDGVHIAGDGYYPAFFGEGKERASVRIYGSSARVESNTIENSGGDGIQIENLAEAEILDNTVNESGEHGLYVSGVSNGYVQVQGNDFTDNGDDEFAQARFESGDIDFSDLINPNTFVKTTGGTGVAMQFEDITAGFNGPSSFPDDNLDAFASDQIDLFGTGLRIVNETLGSTEFTGYTGADNFYVRLEDGSILDPVTQAPIVINGTNASFDGIIPANFANTTLPLATLQFIEDRLYDADDSVVNGRGQIFVGFVEAINGPANFQDFLPEFQGGAPLDNFASVTITGLPSIGNFGGGVAGGLNDIAPAAGDEGTEGEDVAGIEPSAGEGAEVTCLEDAVNGLGSGAVTYNFGGSFEETIAAASGCQSGEI